MIYMEKFSRFFPDQETVDDWCETWGEGLADITGPEIKHGLEVLSKSYTWPPTMAEFRACCKSAPVPYKPMLLAPKHGETSHARECMEKINKMLANPKKPGVWWKQEVRDKAARGEHVSMLALELANSGRQV